MNQYDDNLEKKFTALFGAVGALAVLINLHIKGYEISNVLDATKDIAGLIVVIAVFLVANKILNKNSNENFPELFEKHLREWIHHNAYLISEEFDGDGKGKFSTRFCSMMIDHSNVVTRNKLAMDAAHNKEKATFVRLPDVGNSLFEFRFNERTFERQSIYKKDDKVDLGAIIDQFSQRMTQQFSDMGIVVKSDKSSKAIIVHFDQVAPTSQNAKKLVDLVEFVKTMVLALA